MHEPHAGFAQNLQMGSLSGLQLPADLADLLLRQQHSRPTLISAQGMPGMQAFGGAVQQGHGGGGQFVLVRATPNGFMPVMQQHGAQHSMLSMHAPQLSAAPSQQLGGMPPAARQASGQILFEGSLPSLMASLHTSTTLGATAVSTSPLHRYPPAYVVGEEQTTTNDEFAATATTMGAPPTSADREDREHAPTSAPAAKLRQSSESNLNSSRATSDQSPDESPMRRTGSKRLSINGGSTRPEHKKRAMNAPSALAPKDSGRATAANADMDGRERRRLAQLRFRERRKAMVTGLQDEVARVQKELAASKACIKELELENVILKSRLEVWLCSAGSGRPSSS